MTDDTTEAQTEHLTEQLNDLKAQKRIDDIQYQTSLEKLNEKSNVLLDQLIKRVNLTRQNFKNLQSDDPSVGMRLTDQQRGWWEGRIETWEYALLLARELFQ